MAARVAQRGHRAADIVIDLLIGIVIVGLLACVGARYLLGVHAFSVLSASMSPMLSVGDLVIDVPTAYEDIQVGDVVTYVLNENLDVVTHRVIEKHDEDETLTTKGDANDSADGAPVAFGNVVGVMRASVPHLGNALSFLSTASGKIVGITGLVALMLVLAIVRTLAGMRADDRERDRAWREVIADARAAAEDDDWDDSLGYVDDWDDADDWDDGPDGRFGEYFDDSYVLDDEYEYDVE